MYVGSMSDKGTQAEGCESAVQGASLQCQLVLMLQRALCDKGYVGRLCRKGRRHSSVTLGPRAGNGVEGMSDVCRKYVGQGDSGSCRRSEKILQDLPAYIPLVYAYLSLLCRHAFAAALWSRNLGQQAML